MAELGGVFGGALLVLMLTSILTAIPLKSVSKPIRFAIWSSTLGFLLSFGGAVAAVMPEPRLSLYYAVPSAIISGVSAVIGLMSAPKKSSWNGMMRIRVTFTVLIVTVGVLILLSNGLRQPWYVENPSWPDHFNGGHFAWMFAIGVMLSALAFWVLTGLMGWISRGFRQNQSSKIDS